MDLIEAFVLDGTSYTVDTVWKDNDPLFRASDIAKVLGIGSVHSSLRGIHESDKVLLSTNTLGGTQQSTYLKEQAAYLLVMKSRKPIAQPFQAWLCQVAKSIRTKGVYELEQRLLAEEANKLKVACELNRHEALVSAFKGPDRPVVYFGLILADDGESTKRLTKIGHTADVAVRATGLAAEFGSFRYLEIFDCAANIELESFLHKHGSIKNHAYTGPVYKGRTSRETYIFTDEQLSTAISIASQNTGRYTNTTRLTRADRDRIMIKLLELSTEKPNPSDKVLEEEENDMVPAPQPTGEVISIPDTRRYTQARGNKVQRYSPDGKTLLKTYSGFSEAGRDPELDTPVDHVIRKACAQKTVYKNFRWAELERGMDDDVLQDIGETEELPTQRKGLVAMLHLDRSHIVRVFCDQLDAATDRKFKSCAPISAAIKRGSQSGGHHFQMWCDCSDELKGKFLSSGGELPMPRVRSNGQQIEQLHPLTGAVISKFSSVAHVIKHFRISRASLQAAIESGSIKSGFKWRHASTDSASLRLDEQSGISRRSLTTSSSSMPRTSSP